MNYQYKMVQISPTIWVSAKEGRDQGVAADYLEEVVNTHAVQGWEFYRIDTIGVTEQPSGCLATLFGSKATNLNYYVVTFRKSA